MGRFRGGFYLNRKADPNLVLAPHYIMKLKAAFPKKQLRPEKETGPEQKGERPKLAIAQNKLNVTTSSRFKRSRRGALRSQHATVFARRWTAGTYS